MSDGFLQRGGLWVVGQSALMLAAIVLSITWRSEPGHSVMVVGGVLLLLVGALCGIAGVAALRGNLTPFPKPSVGTRFVQSGIYGLMRHPLYVAVLCASVGWALVWQSWPAVLMALTLAPFFDAKARREERWLREQFLDYADYERRVRRFIPWIY